MKYMRQKPTFHPNTQKPPLFCILNPLGMYFSSYEHEAVGLSVCAENIIFKQM